MIYLGDFPVNSTIYVPFNTFSSVGASVTITGLAVTDIEIYKDGSATQRASDAGYTLLDTDGIDFDGITGIHGFSIDLSDDTDAGFYAAGHEYWIVVASITCDSQTVNFVAGTFSIDRWYNRAISRGQVKITANAANEGALDIRNSNANGHGTLNDGGDAGLYNSGGSIGQYNFGTSTYGIQATGGTDGISATGTSNCGILANGAIAGQYNLGNGGAGYGQYNAGDVIGQYNAASGANGIGQSNLAVGGNGVGQTNSGPLIGEHNVSIGASGVGEKNEGTIDGQYNVGGTYGQQNAGASGQVNVGTAGDGIYASGTDKGLDVSGTVAALSTDPVDQIADQVWDELIAGHLGAGSTGAALNGAGGGATVFPTGAINFTYTVTDSITALPLEGVEVWISTDSPAVNIVWKGDTDAFGVARDVLGNLPALDAGTYYFWRQLAGYTFSDPDSEVVS